MLESVTRGPAGGPPSRVRSGATGLLALVLWASSSAGCSGPEVLSGTEGAPRFLDSGHLLSLRGGEEGAQVQVHALSGEGLREVQAWPLQAGPAALRFTPGKAPGEGLICLLQGEGARGWRWPGGALAFESRGRLLFDVDGEGRLGLAPTSEAYYEALDLSLASGEGRRAGAVVYRGSFPPGYRPYAGPERQPGVFERSARGAGAERLADFLGWAAARWSQREAPPGAQSAAFSPSGHVIYRAEGALFASEVSLAEVRLGRGARGAGGRDLRLASAREASYACAGSRLYLHLDGLLQAYDLRTQRKLWEVRLGSRPEGEALSPGWVEVSPAGTKVACGWGHHPVTVLSAEGGEVLYQDAGPGFDFALSEEALALCDYESGRLEVVSLASRATLFRSDLGTYASVQGLALSPDGRWLALQSQDETWVWPVPAP